MGNSYNHMDMQEEQAAMHRGTNDASRASLSPSAKASVAVILFAIFSFAGWLYETVENVFTFGGIYLRASLMLPWCPIYGVGGLIIVGVLEPLRRRLADRAPRLIEIVVICICIYLLTSAVELGGSYACEAIMGYVPWDYSHAWMNFQGRIAPAYTMRFVLLGLIALYLVYPNVVKRARRNPQTARVIASVIAALFVADAILQAAGVWVGIKDALVPYGISHW